MSCFVGEVDEAFIGAAGLRSIAVVTVALLASLLTAAVEGQRPPALREVSLQFLGAADSARMMTNDPGPPALTTCS